MLESTEQPAPPSLEELLTVPTLTPDVYTHGEWVNLLRNNRTYQFTENNKINLKTFTDALSTGKHFYTPAIIQYETQILINPETKNSWVEDDKGEHAFVKFSRHTGILEMLTASVKVLHNQNDNGEYVIADDYWTANVTAYFHKGKTVEDFYAETKQTPHRTLLLTITSSNKILTITPTEQQN